MNTKYNKLVTARQKVAYAGDPKPRQETSGMPCFGDFLLAFMTVWLLIYVIQGSGDPGEPVPALPSFLVRRRF